MINLPSTLGKSFIVGGFVPALLFVLLNGVFVAPNGLPVLRGLVIPADNPVLTALGVKSVDLTLLVVPSILAVLLIAFNTHIIRFFEGAHGFEKDFILKGLLRRNEREHEARYGDLQAFQDRLTKTSDPLELRGLRMEIARIHQGLFNGLDGAGLRLPVDKRRLMPTRFGNVWGVIEEYPYVRYGMDGTTFWPRMISVVPKEYAEMIASHKLTMDTLLNSSLLAIIFGFEMIIVSARILTLDNALLAAAAFVAAYLLYQAAMTSLLEMGELVKSCYDLFRKDLLTKLGLALTSSDIESERKIWSGLNSYILAGDSYYYPSPPSKQE